MAKNFIIYESRSRGTGALMRTLDLKHKDCPPQVAEKAKGKRYAAQCVDHGVVVFFDEHYPAGRAIAHAGEKREDGDMTQGWCPKCVTMTEKGEKISRPKKDEPAAVEAPAPTPIARAGRKPVTTPKKATGARRGRKPAAAAAATA